MLTAIEVALFDVAMRREVARVGHAPPDQVLHVDLIDEPLAIEPPVVEPVPELEPAIPAGHRTRSRVAPRERVHGPPPETVPEPTPRLFGVDGRVLLPETPAAKSEEGSEALSGRTAHGDAFARRNPLPYAPTRLDRFFPDLHESLGGEIMREAVISKAWRTPWGTVIECKASLVLVGLGGCGWGLAPRLTIDELKALRAPDLPLPPKPPEQPEPPADENPPAAPDAQPVQP